MADYELGTARGRIVVDYDDKGTAQAEQSFEKLEGKLKGLLARFGQVATKWRGHAKTIADGAENVYGKFVKTAQGLGIAGVAIQALSGHIIDAHGGVKMLGDISTALGKLPEGAERFPPLIQRIIQLSAAITVFHGATTLLGRALPNLGRAATVLAALTSRVPGVNLLTRGFASLVRFVPGLGLLGGGLTRLGNAVNILGAPLRVVASAALGVLTVLKGFETVKKYAKYVLGLSAALGTLGAALHVVGGVARAISELSGAIGLLPAAAGVAFLAIGTLKVGMTGMGDAMKAIAKGDAAAFNKAIKDMAPAAQETAKAFQVLYEKGWKPLQKAVQQKLFEGMAPIVAELGARLLPHLERSMVAVAGSFNRAAKEAADFFNNKEVADDFGEGMDYSAKAVDNLTKMFAPLTEAFYLVWRVGTEVLADITKGAGSAAEKFRDFVKEARASGALEAWMRRGVQAVKDLLGAIKNLGQIAKIVFKGLGIGTEQQSFLAWLKTATQRVEDFLNSAKGQQILADLGRIIANATEHLGKLADVFLTHVLPAIQAFLPFWEQMGGAVIDGLVAALIVLAPLFKALGEILSAMAPVLAPIVAAMVFLGTVFLGLGIAAKIAGGAIAIFRTGMLALKGIGFVAGLLTRLGGGFRLLGGALKLLKFGVIVAGLYEVAAGIDKVNLAAVGGDPEKLNDTNQTLHDMVEIGTRLKDGDWEWFGQQLGDIGTEWDTLVNKFNTGESPIGAFAQKVGKSFREDFIAPMEQAGTKVNEFITGVGTKMNEFGNTVNTKIGEVIQWFKDLPTNVGIAMSALGTSISTAASTLWQGFLLQLQVTFQPVIDFFSQTPYQMGFAIGSGIGAIITAAGQLMTSFGDAVNLGITNVLTFFTNLPGRISVALANLGSTVGTAATTAMTEFGNSINTGIDTVIATLSGFGDRANTAISNAPGLLAGTATTAGDNVNTGISTGLDTAYGVLSGFGDRANSAISNVPGILLQKANDAGNSFNRGVTDTFNTVFNFMSTIGNRINQAIGDLGNLLVNAGRAVIDGLLAGIKAGVQAMYDFVSGIAAGIAARKGPLPYDRKLLVPAGLAIINGLTKGMQQAMPGLWRQIGNVNSGLAGIGGVSSAVNLNGTASTSGVTSGLAAPAFRSGKVLGGDGASAGDVYNVGTVTIPAKDIKEFTDVTDFFNSIQQKARSGRAAR